jgi:hypothetical protein
MSQSMLEQFGRRVMSDAGLRARLSAIVDPGEFPAAAARFGGELGLAFSAEEVQAAVQANRRAWFERFCVFGSGANTSSLSSGWTDGLPAEASELAGYMPIGVCWKNGEPFVQWCHQGEARFTEPFFEHALQRLMRLPLNHLIRPTTPPGVLAERAALSPGVPPAGFIFHMSRCGSTLISQMLAALPEHIVLSEPSPLDAVLRAHLRLPHLAEAERIAWVRGMVSALAQPSRPEQRRVFIKFDCTGTLHLPLLKRAFPDVPWIFVYRDPIEVLVSQARQRGGMLLPGAVEPELMGWEDSRLQGWSLDEYIAALLGRVCEAALEHFDTALGRLVHYRELPGAVASGIADHFKLRFSPEQMELLRRPSRRHAKNPTVEFVSDAEAKRKQATDELRRLAERYLSGPYARLEAARG